MSIRRLVVETDPSSMNVAEFCRLHGISTWFFWSLRRRFESEGESALEPRSRAPQRVANRTSAEVEEAIIAVRKRLGEGGWDNGPGSIHDELVAAGALSEVPSESTIWRVLSRRGFIIPQPAKRPKTAGRRFQAARANECWQIDDTGWELADAATVKIINVVDDHSRLALASVAAASCTGAAAFEAIAASAGDWGWPERVLSDNAGALRHVLADALSAIGVDAGHSRPYHPQTCGKVERFHQTLKRFLAAQDPAATLTELQAQLDAFRDHYNHRRGHRPLGRRTPAHVWAQSPRSGPANRALEDPQRHLPGHRHRQGRRQRRPPPPSDSPTPSGATPSASAPPTPARPPPWSSPAWPATSSSTADSSANSPSTPPIKANPDTAAYRERCPATPQRDVPRHHNNLRGS